MPNSVTVNMNIDIPSISLYALLVIVGLQLQILQEEKHIEEMFSKEYNEYANKKPRYLLL